MASPTAGYLLALVAALGVATAARADEPSEGDRRLAQSLFDHARQLLEAGRAAEACPKFAESYRLERASGTLLNLALCHEQEGKSATAWFEYNESLSLAVKENRADREQLARERLAALEPTLLRVAVAPAPGADVAGLEVWFDGTLLRQAAWGTPTVVDPGAHRVEARAPGRLPWAATVVLDRPGQVQAVVVPPLALPPPPTRAEKLAEAKRKADADERRDTIYLLGGAAALAGGVSLVTGLMALSKQGDVQGECQEARRFCTADGFDAGKSARSLAWASTISLGLGVAAGAAIPIVLSSGHPAKAAPKGPTKERTTLRAAARTGPGPSWSLALEGSF